MNYELPYLSHLAFKNEAQWKITKKNDFESLYGLLENKDLKSNNEKLLEVANSCLNSLLQIFNEIKEQASEEREVLFLDELYFHTDRLLKEDINVYKARILSNDFKKNESTFYENKYIIGKISKKSLDTINSEIQDSIQQFRKNAASGKLTREDLSINTGKVVRKVVKELCKEYKKNGVLNLLTEYMGHKQTVVGVSVELSVPNSNWWNVDYSVYNRQPKTLYFHYDESIAYPKSIVYLCNVDEYNGATSCVPSFNKNINMTALQFLVGRAIACVGKTKGTKLNSLYNHKYHQTFGCPLFKNDFSKLPNELRFSSHFGWDVIPDSDLESFLIEDEVKVVGDAGTFIVFDGGTLPHRGGLLKNSERIALQVIFGNDISLFKKIINKLKKNLK